MWTGLLLIIIIVSALALVKNYEVKDEGRNAEEHVTIVELKEEKDESEGALSPSEKYSTPESQAEDNEDKERTKIIEDEKKEENNPKAVEVITKDENSDIVVVEYENGNVANIEIGVVDVGEPGPIIEDDPDTDSLYVNEADQPIEYSQMQEETNNHDDLNLEDEHISLDYTAGPDVEVTYQDYEIMSAQEQMLFYYSFANAEAFNEWYNSAKEEYEANIDKVYINADGSVDMG